jgi:hypothetical protein
MAINFLEAAGANGWLSGPTNVSITLSALASGSAATSSTILGPGNTSVGSAQKCMAYLTVVTAGWTPTAGAVIPGWWLLSTDGGSTFESLVATPSTTVMALPRPPDFIIPVYEGGAALAVGNIKWAMGPFRFPYVPSKIVLQNLTGVAFGTGVHTFNIGGVADQY